MSPPLDPAATLGALGSSPALATVTLPHLAITLQTTDIFRSLGHPADTAPTPETVHAVEELMREANACLQPCGAYSLYAPTTWTDHSFEIGGCTVLGDVREFFQGASRIAVFMATVGNEITRQAEMRRNAGDVFAGRVLDAIGSWATERTAEALMTHLASHLGPEESFTVRYSPGFCGMDLSQQRILFRLAPADAIGITLLPSLFMHPLKSISGLIGLGPLAVVGVHLSPCEPCPLVNCHMRQEPVGLRPPCS
jgi:hypothetical protein